MNIDVVNLNKEIKKLENMLERTSSSSMKIQINNSLLLLYNLYETLTFGECDYNIPLSLYIKQERYYDRLINSFFEELNDMYLYHQNSSKNILKIYKDTKFQNFNQDKINAFKKDEALDILYDFFNDYDPDCYKLVKRMIENNQVSIYPIFDNYQGICYNVRELKKSYILCDIEYFDITGMSIMAHEFGHAINDMILQGKNPQQSVNYIYTNYLEVPSIFFEKMFLDYSLKNRLSDYDTLFALNNIYAELLDNFIAIRFFTHPEMENLKLQDNMEIELKLIKKVINNMVGEIIPIKNQTINFNLRDTFIYGYGMLVAINFIEQYKQSPKETQKNLKNFINSMSLVDGYNILNTCGLNADEISKSKVLKKELKNHMNNIKTELKINY